MRAIFRCRGIGTGLAITTKKRLERREFPMKIEISFLAALLLVGTELMVRVGTQGIEQALLSTVIEYGANGIRAGRRLFPNAARRNW